jgi:hypothetical protein
MRPGVVIEPNTNGALFSVQEVDENLPTLDEEASSQSSDHGLFQRLKEWVHKMVDRRQAVSQLLAAIRTGATVEMVGWIELAVWGGGPPACIRHTGFLLLAR